MAFTAEDVASRYPVHWLVWHNNDQELKSLIQANKFTQEDLEIKDCRGRTPLLLAVTLGHLATTRVLIEAGADVNCEKDGWTAVQEATATGNAELLSIVLSRRDYQRHVLRSGGIPDLLRRLSLAPDFYVEMKWEFTSWVPLVSRMCPFDTYKVYKRGGNVRVDTTLVGFDDNHWQRGDRTYIFRGNGRTASLVELDHEQGTSWCEQLQAPAPGRDWPEPPRHVIHQRLAAPLAINYLDTDKISFERNKSGIWGWRQDKTEYVNSYPCKVFAANNVELVSKTRTEHVPRSERRAPARAPLAGLLALADSDPPTVVDKEESVSSGSSRASEDLSISDVTWQEYFSDAELERDIGRPREITTKVQKFRATLWLCEDYPLELQEQIMPILDLMASISSPHFAKLKDFIQMQLPAGFPVKIEIPLFHVLNARITFGNIFATSQPVMFVEHIAEGSRLACVVDEQAFSLGQEYRDAAAPDDRLSCGLDDEEGLLQYAIQQSLMDHGTQDDQVDVWEALRGARPASPRPARAQPAPDPLLAQEERQLQRAIEASLASLTVAAPEPADADGDADADVGGDADTDTGVDADADAELQAALELSAKEKASRDEQLEAEQRALDEALRLSLLEK